MLCMPPCLAAKGAGVVIGRLARGLLRVGVMMICKNEGIVEMIVKQSLLLSKKKKKLKPICSTESM